MEINVNDLKPLILNVLKEMFEEPVNEDLTYSELKSSPELEILRNAIDNNKTVSIVFVKKDGSVRPIAFRKNFNYDFKGKDLLNTLQGNSSRNNLLKGYDINVYIKAKRELGDPKEAAAKSWRAIKLETVLGFLVGGKFFDLRDENRIMEKFGKEVYNQLTKSMISAANSELSNADETISSMRDSNSFTNECNNDKDDSILEKKKDKNKIDKVMGEFSKGKLKTSYGKKVTDPKQAVAIAYSEAGMSKNESISESIRKEVNRLISESTKTRKMINRIYKVVNKFGLTSKLYNDEYWAGVSSLMKTIKMVEGVTDVYLSVENGGYRSNKEGTQWKEYQLTIETIDGIIEGHINAHAAGTVEDPFKMYDITMTLW